MRYPTPPPLSLRPPSSVYGNHGVEFLQKGCRRGRGEGAFVVWLVWVWMVVVVVVVVWIGGGGGERRERGGMGGGG